MKTVLTIVVVLAVLLAVAGAYWFLTDGVVVQSDRAEVGEIREFVDEQAKTRLPRTHLVTMPYSGRVSEIALDVGSRVEKDAVVAQIVPKDLDLDLKVAQARVDELQASIEESLDLSLEQTSLEQSLSYVESMGKTVEAASTRVEAGKKRLDFAEYSLARAEKLRRDELISEEKYDDTKLQHIERGFDFQQDNLVHSALKSIQTATDLLPTLVRQYIARKSLQTAVLRQQKAAAEAQLEQAKNNAERGEMRSPVDGVVLERHARDERYLSAGTVLLEIGALEELEVEAEILSQDVVNVREGNEVELYGPAIGPQSATGTVKQIYPAGFTKVSSLGVEQQRVSVIIGIDAQDIERLRNEQQIGVGYRVRAKIFTAKKEKALVIPRGALFRGAANDWQVFAVRGGRAKLEKVQVGLMNDERVEITKGLEAGDEVVLAPETSLTDGARVRKP
ncbi:MAG: efflux RND transporter periplasmic adaptor subunit [Planctomycetia bacterium]|nr:efflux RND transporter periplasmic adaptor subunit [Planctomycetia bacterium]